MKKLLLLLSITLASTAALCEQTIRFDNPFPYAHPLQPVSSTVTVGPDWLQEGAGLSLEALNRCVGLRDVQTGQMIPVQWSGLTDAAAGGTRTATVNCIIDLPARTRRELALVGKLNEPAAGAARIVVADIAKDGAVEIRTGRMGVRLAADGSMLPPILAVARLPENAAAPVVWRGSARFADAAPVETMTVQRSAAGPVFYRHTMIYRFALGTEYRCEVTCWAGQDYVTIDETITGPGTDHSGWVLDLGGWPERAFQRGNNRWVRNLADLKPGSDLAMLVNYLMWNNPREAAEVCLVKDPPAGQPGNAAPAAGGEMLDVFSIRRGEWVDKLHEPLALTPLSAHPEESWSQRRWWGSTFGAIRIGRGAEPNAGITITCNFTPGRRSWGILAGEAASVPKQLKTQYDPPLAPSRLTSALGEQRLTEWQQFIFDWQPDPAVAHPRIEVTADELSTIAAKAQADPFFARLQKMLADDKVLDVWRTRDKARANELAREMIARLDKQDVNSILNSHTWLPGHRGIFQLTSHADVLLGTGLIEPDLQKQLRERFALMAYHYTNSSLMDSKYNAGHPNFDADRYAVPAAVAMLYPEHPHAKMWMDHALRQFREALRIYVLPGSGKWAENIGNYYDWSSVVLGTLAHGLQHTGAADPYEWPEFQDFWRWAVPTVMPAKPGRDDMARLERGEIPENIERRRERPSVGDHGRDGGHPFHLGYALAGAALLKHNEQLGRNLLWLWTQGQRPIEQEHHSTISHAPFQGVTLTTEALLIGEAAQSAPDLRSQRLAGYGTVFRADALKPAESFLLFKCGPGGYRYHGEEASFVLFGLGQPLCLDGGEDGRPELHSTVTFGPRYSGVQRGRLVQFQAADQIDYACGMFPGSAEQAYADPKSPAAAWSRDVLGRQILFRKNDYVVIRDTITAVQESQWHLPLTCRENNDDGPNQFTAFRVPGMGNVHTHVTLFHVDNKTGKVRPAEGGTETVVDAVERERFKHDVHQKRRTLRQPPGTSVIAVIDWYTRGQGGQPWPWDVQTDGSRIILTNDKRTATEIVEVSDKTDGAAIPSARWTRLEGGNQVAAWQYGSDDGRLPPIEKVAVRDGSLYVNGKLFLATGWNTGQVENIAINPGTTLRWPKGNFLQAGEAISKGQKVDLLKQEPAIDALDKAGKYAVIIIEPYWGKATPGQGQISWRGEDRAGGGLNTNACWRNPDFIAERLEHVRRVARAVRGEPRAHQRILGYIVWNEQRWAWGDETCYCPHCQAAWAKWLAAQYNGIAALNKEHGTQYAGFDAVPLPKPIDGKPLAETTKKASRPTSLAPGRDVTNVPAWRDFHLFKADGLIEFEKLGAAAAKEADPDRLVISSIFSRDVHPNIGHVMLRLYRELGRDQNIDVIGGNSYEVLPEFRSSRHIAMWRGMPAAHAKPVWFTEFNDHAAPFDQPYQPATLNTLLARTCFSGCGGLIWFTDLIPDKMGRLSVLEPDRAIGERYRVLNDAHALMGRHAELIAEAARNNLPRQVAIVHLDQWNALADNEYYDAASQAALGIFSLHGGFATRYLAEPDLAELPKYPAAVLWQAQRKDDLDAATLRVVRGYVERGGVLFCDLPLLQESDGRGPAGEWAEFAGLRFSNERPRRELEINHTQLGRYRFAVSGTAFPATVEPQDLGQWDVQPAEGTQVIADPAGAPAIVIRPLGKGRVITFCFKVEQLDPVPDNREMAAKLVRNLLGMGLVRGAPGTAGQQPLVELPWLEKTIAPLADGGLLVSVYNGRDSAVCSPLRLPRHPRARITPIRVPTGASVSAESVTLPAGQWMVFAVR